MVASNDGGDSPIDGLDPFPFNAGDAASHSDSPGVEETRCVT
jgi:hypothetical protein